MRSSAARRYSARCAPGSLHAAPSKLADHFARKEFGVAESLYAGVYADGGGYEAFAGYLSSALKNGHMSVLTASLDTTILADEHPARYLPLFITIGDAFWGSGRT